MQYATRVANLSGNGTKYYRMIVIWDLFGAVHYGLVEIFVLTFALEGGDGEEIGRTKSYYDLWVMKSISEGFFIQKLLLPVMKSPIKVCTFHH